MRPAEAWVSGPPQIDGKGGRAHVKSNSTPRYRKRCLLYLPAPVQSGARK
jgi:hypothetical protein